MSDLINRQDAKDAVDMVLDIMEDIPQWAVDDLLNALDNLPSAEPEKVLVAEVKLSKEQIQDAVDNAVEKIRAEMEVPEIIRCKDCKQFRRWIDTDICFCDITEAEMSDNDFCSKSERRTDE